MITQIVVHLLPHEIDWFEWQSKQFKLGSYYINPSDRIIIDTTLNLNLIDWDKSELPKKYFINKFNQIKSLWDWAEVNFIIDEDNKCLGVNDKRRDSIRSSISDNILYLDSDILFKPELLGYIIESSKLISNDYYIITPQTVKIWDNTWDIITNEYYLNTPANMETYHSNDPFRIIMTNYNQNINIHPIQQFKFGGGWFNLLSTKLLKLIDIPDSLGPYGIDDTFVMVCCNIMKEKEINVQQYVLEGTIIIENFKYRWDPYKDLLNLINKQDEFRKQSKSNLTLEIQNFINKI